MSSDKTTQSEKRVVVSSNGRTHSETNTNFKVNLDGTIDTALVDRVFLVSAHLPNGFPNVTAADTFYFIDVLSPLIVSEVSLPTGYYIDLAAINVFFTPAMATAGVAGVTTIGQQPNGKFTVDCTGASLHWLSHQEIELYRGVDVARSRTGNDILGTSWASTGVSYSTNTNFPNASLFGGPTTIHVHSAKLAEANGHTSYDLTNDLLAVIPVNAKYGFYVHFQNPDRFLQSVPFYTHPHLSQIDLRLTDEYGTELILDDNLNVEFVFDFHFTAQDY